MTVFVSFDPRETTAPAVVSALRAAGVPIWDPSLAEGPDKNFVLVRRRAIAQASTFLAVLGESYSSSVLCLNELRLAKRAGVKRAAIIVGDTARYGGLLNDYGFTAVHGLYDPGLNEWLAAELGASAILAPPAAAYARPAPVRATDGYFFINFSHGDRPHLTYLSGELRRLDIPFWDFLQGNRKLQEPLTNEIEDIIRGSVGVLSVVTTRWRASQWSLREYLFARQIGLPTFLLLFEPVPPMLVVSERTFIDFTTPNRIAALGQLSTEVHDVRSGADTMRGAA